MNLTTEQLQAIEKGDPVHIEIHGKLCVILQEQVYDRVKNILEYDDSEMDPREAYPAMLKAWDSQGCPEDATDYQDLV